MKLITGLLSLPILALADTCTRPNTAAAAASLKNNLWDFSNHNFRESLPWMWSLPRNTYIRIGRIKYDCIKIDDNSGCFSLRFQNPSFKKWVKVCPMGFDENTTGFVYTGYTGDRSAMKWNYGNKYKKYQKFGIDGFYPKKSWVITWLNMNNGNCDTTDGNTFQAVIMTGSKGKSRIAFNYGDITYPADIASIVDDADKPRIGTCYYSPSSPKWDRFMDRADGSEAGTPDNVTGLSEHTVLISNGEFLDTNEYDHNDLTNPTHCNNVENCRCPPISSNSQIDFYDIEGNLLADGDVKNHWWFSGFCSETDTTIAYDINSDERRTGHTCRVYPKDTCTQGGYSKGAYIKSPHPDSNADQMVGVFTLNCKMDSNNLNNEARWQRVIENGELQLNKYLDANFRGIQVSNNHVQPKNQKAAKSKWFKKYAAKQAAKAKQQEAAAAAGDRSYKPTETMDMMCGIWCPHPSNFANGADVEVNNQSRNYNTDRLGTWSCKDWEGNLVADGDPVSKGGKCWLTCPGGTTESTSRYLWCAHWDKHTGILSYSSRSRNQLYGELREENWLCDA